MRGPAQKTGRPVKQPNERRCSQMNIRLTLAEAEYIRVQAASAGLTEAEYMRRAATGLAVKPARARADAALISELNAIGNNVNQLARAVHRGRDLPPFWKAIADRLTTLLDEVAARYGS